MRFAVLHAADSAAFVSRRQRQIIVSHSQSLCASHSEAATVCREVELRVRACRFRIPIAGVAELADALDSKSSDRKIVWVRAPPPASSLDVGCWGPRAPTARQATPLGMTTFARPCRVRAPPPASIGRWLRLSRLIGVGRSAFGSAAYRLRQKKKSRDANRSTVCGDFVILGKNVSRPIRRDRRLCFPDTWSAHLPGSSKSHLDWDRRR